MTDSRFAQLQASLLGIDSSTPAVPGDDPHRVAGRPMAADGGHCLAH